MSVQKGGVVGKEGIMWVIVCVETIRKGLGCVPAFEVGGEMLGYGVSISVDVACVWVGKGA